MSTNMGQLQTEKFLRNSWLSVAAKISLVIFAVECLLMFALPRLPYIPQQWLPLLDPACLVLFSAPLLYLWIIIPVNRAYQLAIKNNLVVEIATAEVRRLEAIERLASGISHEINTPIQFASDSMAFVHDGMQDQLRLTDKLLKLIQEEGSASMQSTARDWYEEMDFEYLKRELPGAAARVKDGFTQVTEIIQAMKSLTRCGTLAKKLGDLNRVVRLALQQIEPEIQESANLVMELGTVPVIPFNPCGIQQILQNLVVNASHAIQEKFGPDTTKGIIQVQTRTSDEFVEILVRDNGNGIPQAIEYKVFDPFFTTKDVGKGSGQGLYISRSIVQNHGGTITFESQKGIGTTFQIRLPVTPKLLEPAPEEQPIIGRDKVSETRQWSFRHMPSAHQEPLHARQESVL